MPEWNQSCLPPSVLTLDVPKVETQLKAMSPELIRMKSGVYQEEEEGRGEIIEGAQTLPKITAMVCSLLPLSLAKGPVFH